MLPVLGGDAPAALPNLPFDVSAPEPFRDTLVNATGMDDDQLRIEALRAQAESDAVRAAAWHDKLVRTTEDPSGFFDNARLLVETNEIDAALYWLIRGVKEHGVPPQWLVDNREFRWLWADPRWDGLIRWTMEVQRYYASKGTIPATIILPTSIEDAWKLDLRRTGAKPPRRMPEKPNLPVFVWLEGAPGNGSRVLDWGQKLSDELGIIIVGIGGPERVGIAGSWWTSDPVRDAAHITNTLDAVQSATADPERRYVAGVGQGAQYAVELALRDKNFTKGVLAFAPTEDWTGARDKQGENQRDRDQIARLEAGALRPMIHNLLRRDLGRLSRAGVQTEMSIDEEPWPSMTPRDLEDRVTRWLYGIFRPTPSTADEPEETKETKSAARSGSE